MRSQYLRLAKLAAIYLAQKNQWRVHICVLRMGDFTVAKQRPLFWAVGMSSCGLSIPPPGSAVRVVLVLMGDFNVGANPGHLSSGQKRSDFQWMRSLGDFIIEERSWYSGFGMLLFLQELYWIISDLYYLTQSKNYVANGYSRWGWVGSFGGEIYMRQAYHALPSLCI